MICEQCVESLEFVLTSIADVISGVKVDYDFFIVDTR